MTTVCSEIFTETEATVDLPPVCLIELIDAYIDDAEDKDEIYDELDRQVIAEEIYDAEAETGSLTLQCKKCPVQFFMGSLCDTEDGYFIRPEACVEEQQALAEAIGRHIGTVVERNRGIFTEI